MHTLIKIFGIGTLLLGGTVLSMPTIILDPGHGGVYTGQTSANKKLIEKDVALDIAQRVATLLREKKYNVIFTRTTDTQLDKDDLIKDLTMRADLTKQHNADVYVSLHLNGSPNQQARGYEIYVPFMTKYPRRSYALASSLHYELTQSIDPVFGGGSLGNLNNLDRGIKAAKFNVLVKSHCPAALIEMDFITNETVEKLLMTDAYRDTLANAVYRGIRRYFIGIP